MCTGDMSGMAHRCDGSGAVSIRAYDDAHDRAGLAELYRAAWHAAYDAVDGYGAIERLIEALSTGEPPQMFALPLGDTALVARAADGPIVGGVRGHPRAGIVHLSGMYVHPQHLRCGLGCALMVALVKHYPSGTVWRADVRPQSVAALAFYERLGFVRTGLTRTDAGAGHWVDTIEMQGVIRKEHA